MRKFSISEYEKQGINIQIIPLIDVLFFALILFMSLYAMMHVESETNISVPQATVSQEAMKAPGEIVINITKEGSFIVNGQTLDKNELENKLKEVGKLFPNQPVVIRADQETYHRFVVDVLEACSSAKIWDISFSASTRE